MEFLNLKLTYRIDFWRDQETKSKMTILLVKYKSDKEVGLKLIAQS